MDEKFIRNAAEAVDNWTQKELREPPKFGGEPGEPVPEVDPDDIKTAWTAQHELEQRHPTGPAQLGAFAGQYLFKPGTDIQAVGYRATLIWMMTKFAPEQIAPYLKDGLPTDAVFRAASKVRLEWMGVGIVRQGPPFDVTEFLRLCNEA